ncbi:MAG: hypothetical protein DBY43_02790 [Clostridiaceae bacterium]|nr:MAG: hypothetical protein DBY43_02790 [Clostridiaceae bacterium]
MNMWHDILMVFIGIIIGAIAGFFLCRYFMMNYFKKNPPINEKMIETLMSGMGRKPSQKQVKQLMQQMNRLK